MPRFPNAKAGNSWRGKGRRPAGYNGNVCQSKFNEDTDDASEGEESDLRQQVLDEQFRAARREVAALKDGTHPDLVAKMDALVQEQLIRQRENQIARGLEIALIESECEEQMNAAGAEFKEKEKQMKESLISTLEFLHKETEVALAKYLTDKKNGRLARMESRRCLDFDPDTFKDLVPFSLKKEKRVLPRLQLALDEKIVEEDIRKINGGLSQIIPVDTSDNGPASSLNLS